MFLDGFCSHRPSLSFLLCLCQEEDFFLFILVTPPLTTPTHPEQRVIIYRYLNFPNQYNNSRSFILSQFHEPPKKASILFASCISEHPKSLPRYDVWFRVSRASLNILCSIITNISSEFFYFPIQCFEHVFLFIRWLEHVQCG